MSQASDDQERIGRVEDAVNTYSRPSELKITDLRLAVVASNYDYPIIRIDTNQGVYGIGEVRDAGHREDALRFKSFLLGQNPLCERPHPIMTGATTKVPLVLHLPISLLSCHNWRSKRPRKSCVFEIV